VGDPLFIWNTVGPRDLAQPRHDRIVRKEKRVVAVPRFDVTVLGKERPEEIDQCEPAVRKHVPPVLVRLLVEMMFAALPGHRCREQDERRVGRKSLYKDLRRVRWEMLSHFEALSKIESTTKADRLAQIGHEEAFRRYVQRAHGLFGIDPKHFVDTEALPHCEPCP
jgi:hypothetical protein